MKPQKRRVFMEGSGPQPRLGHGCQPLIEKLVEGGRRAQRPAQIPLLKFQIQQALRLAKRAVDGLVQVPARPALGSRP